MEIGNNILLERLTWKPLSLRKIVVIGCALILLGTILICLAIGCKILEDHEETKHKIKLFQIIFTVFGVSLFFIGSLLCYIAKRCKEHLNRSSVSTTNLNTHSEIQNSVGNMFLQNPPPENYFQADFYSHCPPSYDQLFIKSPNDDLIDYKPPCYSENDVVLHL